MDTTIRVAETMSFDKDIKDSSGVTVGSVSAIFDTKRGSLSITVTSSVKDSSDVQKQLSDFISCVRSQASLAGLTQFSEPTT